MSYCPKCHHEYADTVERCVECGHLLRKGRRPVRYDLEFEDILIPVGSFVLGCVALAMLYARIGAQFGWFKGPLATMVLVLTPPCLTVFYALALAASLVVFSIWVVQRIILRRN